MARTKKDEEYEQLETLDLLIDLREDMEDLGIRSIEELDERIRQLEAELKDDDGPV